MNKDTKFRPEAQPTASTENGNTEKKCESKGVVQSQEYYPESYFMDPNYFPSYGHEPCGPRSTHRAKGNSDECIKNGNH